MEKPVSNIGTFFREVKAEARKVNWPTREHVTESTIIVLSFAVVIATFLGFLDFILARIIQLFFL
ncbi:MAG: preprotein translocase subunit SecE [bacterium]|nr:preprotein translocase subunit SecE [bacterium]